MSSPICRLLKYFALLGACLLGGCQPAKHDESPDVAKIKDEQSKDGQAKYSPASSAPTDGRAVLERMVDAYRKCKSYSDFGVVTFQADTAKGPINQRADFQVAFERPNKLHMKVYDGEVCCDGKRWFAFSKRVDKQYVLRDAPQTIRPDILEADQLLLDSMSVGMAGSSLQMMLLTYEDPLRALLYGADDVQLEESGKMGDHACYRVSIKRKDGNCVFWIDQDSFIVRQMVVPSDVLRRDLELRGSVNSLSVIATFDQAQFDAPIPPVAFQFEAPAASEKVKMLMQPTSYDLVGKKLPEFHFKDLNGAPWNSKAYLGKTVLLEFWASDCAMCLSDLPKIQEVYEKFKDSGKVAVFAVCLDPNERTNAAIAESAKVMKVNVPVLRDPDLEAGKLLEVMGPPTTLFIDAQGTLQDCALGGNSVEAATAPHKIERMLAGESLAAESIAQYRGKIRHYEQGIDQAFAATAHLEVAIEGKTAPAAKSAPKTFHLVPLWKSTEVRPAGNLIALPQADGSVRLIAVDGYKGLAEFSGAGKFIASHKPQLEADEIITNLRVGAGSDGKPWLVGFAPTYQRLFLFDQNLKATLSYPPDALTNRHPGISDVQLGDLDGDGILKMYVSYFGTVGVQSVSLEGHRQQSYRNLLNVGRITIGAADADKKRDLYCATDSGSIAVLNAKFQIHSALTLPAQMPLQALAAGDFNGNGHYLWCAVAQAASGQLTAMGLNLRGEVAWNFPLPKGPPQPVESVLIGSITPGGPKCWILPGCDGSINIIAADGQLIDRFNYGAAATGVATYMLDGKAVIAISSQDGVEAFRIE